MIPRDVVLVLSALVAVTAGQSLGITPTDDTYTRPLGASILISCSAIGVDPDYEPDLKWFDDENSEITSTTGRMYIEREGLKLKLYITTIENEDAGTYTCRGDIDGAPVEESKRLEIFMDITFVSSPTPQNPRIYSDALIECKVDGQPKPIVSWRHKGDTIGTGEHYSQEDSGLRVFNITLNDNGQYVCRAEVAAEGRYDERTITVDVHIPPTITEGVGNQEGIENQETSLTCGAESLPPPKFEFYKDGNQNEVQPDDRISIDKDKGVIDFRPLIKADEGSYMCKAVNDVGEASDTGHLKVLVPPKIHTLINQTSYEGQTATLTCICEADPPPTMTFHKMGNPEPYELGENENGKVILRENSDCNLEMEIMNLTPQDTDNYTCISVNEAGEHKLNGSVDVRYSPRFDSKHPTEFYLWAGKTRNLTCATQAQPEPKIRWYHDDNSDKPLNNNETYKIYEMGKNSNLQITCREEDQGWIYNAYRCEADNDIDPVGSIELNVLRATLPGAPESASIQESSPTHVVLTVAPPVDDGGIDVYAYRVEYETTYQDFGLAQEIRIENLKPHTPYRFKIRAKNEVGVGNAYDFDHETEAIRAPYPIVLLPEPAQYAFEYTLRWEAVRTGGLPIEEYEFKHRKVTKTLEGTVDEPIDSWIRSLRYDDSNAPMTSYELVQLSPETDYQVEVRARNDYGWSDPNKEFTFRTQEDPLTGEVGGCGLPVPTSFLVAVCALFVWEWLGLAA